ncbi:ATP-binding cassette domain-containing protein [Oerskovia sp. M15]
MQITLDDVQVEGRRSPMLDAMSLALASGECVLLAGEPGHGHTALALVATGRLAPYSGTVTLVDDDGSTSTDPAELRRVTAVVDVPGISEPDEALTVGDVVAEELSLAGQRSFPGDAKRWLEAHDLHDRRSERIDELHGTVRTALLASLASERRNVRFVVLTLPDRHSGEPTGWWSVAESLASLGYGCSSSALGRRPETSGGPAARARRRRSAHSPVEALRTRPRQRCGADLVRATAKTIVSRSR